MPTSDMAGMLILQHYSPHGLVPVGSPYALACAHSMMRAATTLALGTGAVWRVVGAGGRVLSLWDGWRWQTVDRAQPAAWWDQRQGDLISTIQTAGLG